MTAAPWPEIWVEFGAVRLSAHAAGRWASRFGGGLIGATESVNRAASLPASQWAKHGVARRYRLGASACGLDRVLFDSLAGAVWLLIADDRRGKGHYTAVTVQRSEA